MSLTCRLLQCYLQVNCGTQSQFIARYYGRLHKYGDLRRDEDVRRLIKDITRERFFTRARKNGGLVLDVDQVFAKLEARSYRAVVQSILSQFAARNGMSRWGGKIARCDNDLPVLRELFPDAQFVHVVRDGRDVTLSLLEGSLGPRNAYLVAREWQYALSLIQCYGTTVPSDQYFEFRYEDLISDPPLVVRQLAQFLGIDERRGAWMDFVHAHIRHDVTAINGGTWIHDLAPREVERFEAVAGAELARHGYTLSTTPASRPIHFAEDVYWRLHNRYRQLLMTR
jgi:hypothetical protein